MRTFGTHYQPKGTWSDDSSLTFCLAESLCKGYVNKCKTGNAVITTVGNLPTKM
nr:ADP-ribosylglycohydrolase family protein [Tenacibaculum maritimum]